MSLASCSIELNIWQDSTSVLSGKVHMPGITSSATCLAGDKIVHLHKLNLNGTVDETPIASVPLDASYEFSFPKIAPATATEKYILKSEACGKKLSRPVTGLGQQDITYVSSLVGLIPYVQLPGIKTLHDFSNQQIEDLISTVAAAPSASSSESISEVYDSLVAAGGTAQRNQLVADLNLNAITDLVSQVPPYIETLTTPPAYNEMSAAAHTVVAAHWYGSYDPAYEWILNGVSVGNASSYTFTPGKNAQGISNLTLKIGTDDGGGLIATTDAVLEHQLTFNILNTFPALAPAITLTSPSVTNSLAAVLSVNTGASLINCETFSSFAISESAVSATVSPSAFSEACTTDTAQTANYNLSPGDGSKTIYVWSKDAAGNISTLATSAAVTLDMTAPSVSLSGVPTVISGGTAMSLTFSASDATSGVAAIKLQYSADGVAFTDVATLTAASSPFTGYTPSASGYLRLHAVDVAGNPNNTTPVAFTYDNSPPAAPVVTLTTAAITNNPVVGMSLANCTDTAMVLITETVGAPSAASTSWVACATPLVYNHTITGESTHTIYVWAKDSAGNISLSAGSTSVILDVTPPTLAWTAPTTDLRVSTTATVTWRTTDIHTSTSQNSLLEYSDDAGATWSVLSTQAMPATSASNYVFNYSWSTPATLKTAKLRATSTDSAGNQASIVKDLIIESERPVIDTFTLADGATIVGISSVNATLGVTPSTSVTSWMRFAETDFDVNTDNNTGWVPFSATGMSYVLSSSPGNHTVYAQVKNNAGIMSLTKTYTVRLELGTPPIIKVTSPSGSGTYLPTQVMPITWNCASSDAGINLASSPISIIQYTIDDGISYFKITDSTESSLAASGTYNWTIPATTPQGQAITANTPIRVLVACKTEGGVITTALSAIQNSSWQVLVGDPGNLEYGVHISAADISSSNGVFADGNSNLYYGSRLRHAIMKMDRQTGIVSEWLGSMSMEGCPTSSVAQFTVPRIIDITGGEMTIVSAPCSTITRIKISDKSIVWNRTIPQLNGDERTQISNPVYDAYIKSGYYYFPSYHTGLVRVKAYYEVDLNNVTSIPKLVIGSQADCTGAAPSIGDVGDAIGLTCLQDYNGWIAVMPDRSKAYIYHRTGVSATNRFSLDYNSGTDKWVVSSTTASVSNPCSRVMYVGTDTSKYFCMQNVRSGNRVAYVDTSTGNYGGTYVALGSYVITDFQATLGSSSNSVYVVSRDTNELFEVKYNTDWNANKIGGSPFLTYGNGTDPTLVAFTSIAGLAYDSTNKYLYTRGVRHLRRMKVDTTTTPGTPFISRIDTAYPSSISGLLNTYGALILNNTGSKILMNTGSTSGYKWEGVNLSPALWPEGSNSNLSSLFDMHTGTSGTVPTLGTSFNRSSNLIWDWGSTATYMADDNFYFAGYSTNAYTQNLAIYRSLASTSTNGIVAIAGKTGAAGATAFTDGATALGVGFSRIYGMQEDATGELMVFDEGRVLQITAKANPASPKIYLLHDLTTFTNYPTGKTWIDAVHDNATGWSYFLANDATAEVTEVYAAHDTAKTFVQISTAGLDLPGVKPGNRGKAFYLKVTPLGLLMQDAYKRRILTTPLMP
ncbi:hypothetical protein [Bdellovibrio sp. HCB274]|uniref:hypothetical protein n=1 Tax=Bdellovibrio sp. HCB274 TaxID=3394361 RepID=UPI0039B4443A